RRVPCGAGWLACRVALPGTQQIAVPFAFLSGVRMAPEPALDGFPAGVVELAVRIGGKLLRARLDRLLSEIRSHKSIQLSPRKSKVPDTFFEALSEVGPQFLPGIEEPAHHGADRDAERVGNLAITQFRLGVQDEGHALWLGERSERRIQLPPQVRP